MRRMATAPRRSQIPSPERGQVILQKVEYDDADDRPFLVPIPPMTTMKIT